MFNALVLNKKEDQKANGKVEKIDIKDLPQDTKAAHLIGVPNPKHNEDGDFSLRKDLIEIKDGKNSLTWCGISIINPIIFNKRNFESKSFNIWDTVLPSYIAEGVVTGEESLGLWVDVGTPERLKLANSVYNDK